MKSRPGESIEERTLKEAKVKFALVHHLKDFYPDIKSIPNPLSETMAAKNYYTPKFVPLGTFVLQEKFYKQMADLEYSLKFQRSTARENIFCDPNKTKVAISMIGELCPGKNVVLRSLVKCLEHEYGVEEIYGVKWGFRGFCEEFPKFWVKIDAASLEGIQHQGGAKLGTCRHVPFDAEKVADRLEE